MEKNKVIVVSGVNLIEGGALAILNQCIGFLSEFVANRDDLKIIALVHDEKKCYYPNIEYIEIRDAKRHWLKRIYYEYFYFYRLSLKIKPYLWLSLHDMTPNVCAFRRVVYCHNPCPFYKPKLKDIYYNYKIFLFSWFYKYLYKINIKENDYLIVQQSWLREEFVKMFKLDKYKIIVSYPKEKVTLQNADDNYKKAFRPLFFFPSLSRPFKNFEIIGKATEILCKEGDTDFDVAITIDGSEDPYAKHIYKQYSYLKNIQFLGRLKYEDVLNMYKKTDCLIFPSQLETWGLPISEFAQYNKPMLIADLPYAKETASSAKKVVFFDPLNAIDLANGMRKIINNEMDIFNECPEQNIDPPFTKSWEEIFKIIGIGF